MPDATGIRFGDTTINYAVRRSRRRRKTIQITVSGDGVLVSAPMKTPDSTLRELVQKRAQWIMRRLEEAAAEAAPQRFVDGETLPYLGRDVRMTVKPRRVPAPEIRLDDQGFQVAVPMDMLDDDERSETIRRAFIGWYRERAEERLPEVVSRWRTQLERGKTPSRVLVRDQRRRWGSCAADGALRFNWRVIMLDPSLIEYIVVHELAHLTHRNHSPDFWHLVSRTMPDAQERRRRLRDAGRALPL